MTKEEEEAKRKADEEEAKRKAAESDDGSQEDEDTEEADLTVDDLKKILSENKKHIKKLNKESADRRIRLEEFENEKNERENAEKTELEKAQKRADDLEAKNAAAEEKARRLELQRDFENLVRDAKLEFRNSHAAQDAFAAVLELMDDDETELTEEHVKQVVKERDYYFGKPETVNINNNDSKSKGKSDKVITTQQAVAAKRKTL